jgi:Cu-Zn family superoxide dismutase
MATARWAAAGILVAAAGAAAVAGCAAPDSGGPAKGGGGGAEAVLEAKSGSSLRGKATFRPMGDGWIEFRVEVSGVTPGLHAIHVHEHGDCSAADGTSTGGHWNPTGKKHGKWGQADGEFHLGDLGNIEVGSDGTGSLMLTTNLWTLGDGGPVDVVGRSIIVHGGADDFTTQPTGNAGNRIGAGPIVLAGR